MKAGREQQWLSRQEAAEQVGIGRDYLASIERGEGNLALQLRDWPTAWGVDVYVLIGENETVARE